MSDYDLETVQAAVTAAGKVGRYDLAQEIVDLAKSDLCVVCALHWSTIKVNSDHGVLQVCAACAEPYETT